MTRRRFLQATLAGLSLAGFGARLALATGAGRQPLVLSAVDDAAGNHFIAGIDLAGRPRFQIPVDDRCHGGCQRPGIEHALLFARRPGRHFYIVDTRRGEEVARIEAREGFHFYGHGVFSRDSRYLYVTLNHFPSGEGVIRVYDADENYRHIADYALDGIGPHELRLHPDGETLVIALGGIKTHPDYDRIKLNLDTMETALVLMDRRDGRIHQRFTPSHHQLSCRHLDIAPDGTVIAGYQYQGPEWETPPLIARLDGHTGKFSEIALPEDDQSRLRNYTASIAVHPETAYAAITAPRGNRVVIIDYRKSRYVRSLDVPDVAGALPLAGGGFVVSSGNGSVQLIHPDRERPELLTHLDLRWDNHLTLFA
ncbi:DUF1513 domain-containing protein [Marinobacter nanhaiticus D15-8W]|uniref:DUF1513 domain-containing protein n=2 Tax=Marinobacter TaxID=2742 RepID=N6VZ59_9GAMM|nr:DUF1513 domain-containing protein [Marinobacter nanhaiticus D15-8W]